MKAFFIAACLAAMVVVGCSSKKAHNKSPCVTCAHEKCVESMGICAHTNGCEDETICLLDCSNAKDDVAFKLCALGCMNEASAESTEAARDFLYCYELTCEPTCHGTSI